MEFRSTAGAGRYSDSEFILSRPMQDARRRFKETATSFGVVVVTAYFMRLSKL